MGIKLIREVNQTGEHYLVYEFAGYSSFDSFRFWIDTEDNIHGVKK